MSFLSQLLPISDAHAASTSTGGYNPTTQVIFLIAFVVIFYFILMRPQAKRQKEHQRLIQQLAKGDEVSVNNSLIGKITKVEDTVVHLEISKDVVIQVQKSAVNAVLPQGTYQ